MVRIILNITFFVLVCYLFCFLNTPVFSQNLTNIVTQKSKYKFEYNKPLKITHTDSAVQEHKDTSLKKENFKAFKHYLRQFKEYEKQMHEAKKEEIRQRWLKIQKEYQAKQKEHLNKKNIAIMNAINYYEEILKKGKVSSPSDKALVMLNLAKALNILAHELKQTDPALAETYSTKAVNFIAQIEKDYPSFEYIAEALYLKALILEEQNMQERAIIVWQKLSKLKIQKSYVISAHVFIGDYFFNKDETTVAQRYYQEALSLLAKNKKNDLYEEQFIRIQYRLAWASYRIADYSQTIKSCLEILKPIRMFSDQKEFDDIKADVVELIAGALFGLNNLNKIKSIFKLEFMKNYASKVSLYLIEKYYNAGLYDNVVKIGNIVVNNFYFDADMPQILRYCAQAAQNLKRNDVRIAFLEKLSILLAPQSLWRAKNKDNIEAVKQMEQLARSAALTVAEYYFDLGNQTLNKGYFSLSAMYYQILVDCVPQDLAVNEWSLKVKWKLKIAENYYLSEKFDQAINLYEDLYKNYKLQDNELKITLFQLALSYEKKFRILFVQEYGKNQITDENQEIKEIIKYLSKLNNIVNIFADKYPDSNKTPRLLLMAGSANRDVKKYDVALQYWNRVLLSNNADINQGAAAIRGIIYATIKVNTTREVIEQIVNFLTHKNKFIQNPDLYFELLDMLSKTVISESEQRKNSADYADFGNLMVKIAQEYKDLPQRDKIFKDGAYFLAFKEDWSAAQKACLSYINLGLVQYKGDILYLLAKSYEYQLRFKDAILYYMMLAQDYPKHSRAIYSASKALELAIGENDFKKAAESCTLKAVLVSSKRDKFNMYIQSAEYYQQVGMYGTALNQIKKAIPYALSIDDKIKSQILLYKYMYKSSDEKKAIDGLMRLYKNINQNKNKLVAENYALYASQINYLIAEDAALYFYDYDILERGGSLQNRINIKSNYFSKLVKHYDIVSALNLPSFGPEARFKISEAADKFADDLTMILNSYKLETKHHDKYVRISQRLKALSRRYLTNNMVVANKQPYKFKNNEWIYKSSLKLGRAVKTDFKNFNHQGVADTLPQAIYHQLPLQWRF